MSPAAVEAGAPGRVTLARGLALAIDRRATCRVERQPGGVTLESKEALARAEAPRLDQLRPPSALEPLARLLGALGLRENVRVVGHGRVPAGAGLATEAALVVAAAAAALRVLGQEAPVAEVVRLAGAALTDREGSAPAGADLWAAVYGGAVAGEAGTEPQRVDCDAARIEEALLLADVGVAARPARLQGAASAEERAQRDNLVAALAARHDALVPDLIAGAFDAACRADSSLWTPEAAPVLEAVRALGGAGRPCGAGGGGLFVLWIAADARQELRRQLAALGARTYPCRVDLLGLELEPY